MALELQSQPAQPRAAAQAVSAVALPPPDPLVERAGTYLQTVVDYLATQPLTREQATGLSTQLHERLHRIIRAGGGEIDDLTGDKIKDYETLRAFFLDRGVLFTDFDELQRDGSGKYKKLVELVELKRERISVDPAATPLPGVDSTDLTESQRAPIEVRETGRVLARSQPAWYLPTGQTMSFKTRDHEPVAIVRPDNIAEYTARQVERGAIGRDEVERFSANVRQLSIENEAGHALFRRITGVDSAGTSNRTEVGTYGGAPVTVLQASEAFSDYYTFQQLGNDPARLERFLQMSGPFERGPEQYKFSHAVMAGAIERVAREDARLPDSPNDPQFHSTLSHLILTDPKFAENLRSAVVGAYESGLAELVRKTRELRSE